MRIAIICLLSIFFLEAAGQSKTQPYTKLVVEGNVQVILRPDDMYDIDIIEDSDKLTFNVENGTATIRSTTIDPMISGQHSMVTANYKRLNSIELSNGAIVEHEGILNSDMFEMVATSGASSSLAINTTVMDASIDDGSVITLSGMIDSLHCTLGSESLLSAGEMVSGSVWIHTSEGATATVYASDHITAKAESDSTIKILGDPESEKVSEMTGGRID